jgi:superoxide dismutase, Fe-Mn family
MPFTLPNLPYPTNALEPHISARTLEFHHGKHHAAYVNNLNGLTANTPLANAPLERVILDSAGDPAKQGIFNNSAQVWNHTFFWNCMKPKGGGRPSGELAKEIDTAFGSFEKFVEEFKTAAVTQFGSGWAWLAVQDGKLKVVKTANADMPLTKGMTPILTVDVWEHAYYLDYQNRRPDFVQTFIDHLINWDFVAQKLGQV